MVLATGKQNKYILIFLLFILSTLASTACAEPSISSTFIQLDQEKSSLEKSDWEKIFRKLHDVGIREVILQWTAINKNPFFTPYRKMIAKITVVDFLDIAKSNQIKLKIGLIHDPEFWVRIKERPRSLKIYFARLAHDSLQLLRELYPLVHRHPAFAGWYIPQEIDDTNWIKPEKRKVLLLFLKEVTGEIKKVSPGTKIAISGFSNCKLSPLGMAKFWRKIFSSAHIDSIYYQDGIGTKKQDFCTLPLYFDELSNLARKSGVNFVPVIEFFNLASEKEGTNLLSPESTSRVTGQIRVAAKYSGKISSFGLVESLLSNSPFAQKVLKRSSPCNNTKKPRK